MSVTIEPLVMVRIVDDRETTLAFLEWRNSLPDLLPAGRHGSVSGDSHTGYYEAKDEARIRTWFDARVKP